jgi:GNAT superfamily N-acetyltransferase
MIRLCEPSDHDTIHTIINDAAGAYAGVIPADRWSEPYMPKEELLHEIDAGVVFWGYEENRLLLGVIGLQHVSDVSLIRHMYVRSDRQRQGIGGKLLRHLLSLTDRPFLIGTWADADWAIQFYEKYGFRLVSSQEKDRLLRRYWTIPERQIETSVVLVGPKWSARRVGGDQSHAAGSGG